MKTIHDIDDSRLTAWALGELDGSEAEAVAAFVETSEMARAEVARIRELADRLRDDLTAEGSADGSGGELTLDTARRDALVQALDQRGSRAVGGRPTLLVRLRPFLSVAAVLALAFVVGDVLLYEGAGPGPEIGVADAEGHDRFAGGKAMSQPQAEELSEPVSGVAASRIAAQPAPQLDDGALDLRALGYVGDSAPARATAPAGEAMPAGLGEGTVAPQAAGKQQASLAVAAGSGIGDWPVGQVQGLGYGGVGGQGDREELLIGRSRSVRGGSERGSPTPGSPGERYAPLVENPFVPLTADPLSALSTFAIDVDTAAYANVRRFLHRNQLPPPDAVRVEELINAFRYDDPLPEGEGTPLAVSAEVAACPWQPRHRLVRLALTGERIAAGERPPTQLVLLLDVSGSMQDADKLPLLIASLRLLLDELGEQDKVAIVTYAAGTELVLPPTSCAEKQTILAALGGLRADGSTHASAGIQLAYDVAAEGFIEGGNNRILLATDGDFNVGITSDEGLLALIREKAAGGVFLTVLGFGTGNLQDATAELLADKGNGNYAYIDSLNEAYKVLVAERDATLVTVAKDVKLQLEFNPAKVAAYRLIGYENRALAAVDFRDDAKDAGEVGAGHTVVALYEVVPRGVPGVGGTVELKYQQLPEPATFSDSPELLTVNLRWKRPDEDQARELAVPLIDEGRAFAEADEEFRFSAAVAAFGMVLRGSAHAGNADMSWVVQTADGARSFDPDGDRSEFVRLARTAQGLLPR